MFWQMNSISFLSIRDVSTDKRASVCAWKGVVQNGGRSTTYEIEWGGGLVHLITYYSRIQWPGR